MDRKKLLLLVIVIPIAAFFLVGYGSCHQNPILLLGPSFVEVQVTTDKQEYKIGETVSIDVRNTGNSPVFFASNIGNLQIRSVDSDLGITGFMSLPAHTQFDSCTSFNQTWELESKGVELEPGAYEVIIQYWTEDGNLNEVSEEGFIFSKHIFKIID